MKNHHKSNTRQNKSESDRTVVGIGASAGGLSALKTFFDKVPSDSGLSFVVVVHLAPDHASHLADLLQPHTRFPVQQVTETTLLQPNNVYIIPPNANINAIDTHLRLSDLEEQRTQRAPIDHFLRTLASTHDGHSVAVILTGTGSDGTLGVREVKAKGGVVIIQDPREAEFDGMPQSAIATGMADLILPVAEIPGAILRINQTHPRVFVPDGDEEESEPANRTLLQQIFTLMQTHTGRDFSRYKRSTILRRIARRMQINYLDELKTYLQHLREQPNEVRSLADDLLITVTNFFRDPAVFEKLEKEIIPQLFDRRTSKDSVRVWSVGCATGEEAYSIAMLLLEEAARRESKPQIQVFASDLHHRSLLKAREGSYPGDIETDLTPERVMRFFQKENGGFRIRQEVRELVVFTPHNLLGDPPFSRLDLVSCRNLLIYLDREVQHAVIDLFHYSLNQDGILLLGSAENIEPSDLFRVEDKRLCIYSKRNVPVPEPRLPVFPLNRSRLAVDRPWKANELMDPLAHGWMHQRMAELYAPPSILISPDNKIVHLSEHGGAHLKVPGGELTANVFKLVRDELRVELQGLLQTARQRKEPVVSRPIVLSEGGNRSVVVSVRPALEPQHEGFALLIFEERSTGSERSESVAEETSLKPDLAARARELENELDVSRQRLGNVIKQYETAQEEMKASNEEMQSSNEEIRSTMEELETSKEELQSINEELQTVNQENRHKVEELAQLSSDLQNLLAATGIATLFLDRNLRILRFTPKVSDLFNIRTTDRGRPLSDQTHRLGYAALESDAKSVLDTLVPIEREVQDKSGQWYLTRVLPYRSDDDRIEGVVITFVDITRRVIAEIALSGSERQLSAELDAMKRLHELVAGLLVSPNLSAALQTVLSAAVEIMGAQTGIVWLVNAVTDSQQIVASQGVPEHMVDYYRAIDDEPHSACDRALKSGVRVIIGNIETDPLYEPIRVAAISAGYHAAQYTPLVSRDDHVLGILATYFTEPHLPPERDLRILDLYSRQAADFVERRRSEEELRQSEERYRLLIENAREYAILMLDSKGYVATWNAGAERIFGYSEAEILGRSGALLFTAEDRDADVPMSEMNTASSGGRAADDRWHVRKDGSRFWASGVMEALDTGSDLHGYVKVLRDNTERKQAEESLRSKERHLLIANEALSKANSSLRQFAYAASHDLREPLRTISSYVQILIVATKQDRQRDAEMAARFITESTNRMGQLLTDLLTYTELTVKEEDEAFELVDLNVVVEKAMADLGMMIEQSGSLITRDTLPVIRGHESNFVQLFQNLIANAIKYRSDRPLTINISAERFADDWRLKVSDNGIGIAPEYHETIFGVFKRLHGSKIPGTGIGLAICRRVVERFGGRIWVESEVDQGSTFVLIIPASEEAVIANPAGMGSVSLDL